MENQFETIRPWVCTVLEAIKKEIKCEHLPSNPVFARTHFGHRPLNRLKIEEIFSVYEQVLLSGDELLSEWVVNRWVFRHSDLYSHFAEKLSLIDENYTNLVRLTEEQSAQVLQGAVEKFGALPVYLFSVLNRVVFPEEVFKRLRALAEAEESAQKEADQKEMEQRRFDREVESYKRELIRMQEKYESKVTGMLKKYQTDVDALKKQIRSLQGQLASQKTSV